MKSKIYLFFIVFMSAFLFGAKADFQGVETTNNQETEAGLNNQSASFDFCCDRERPQDSAQDMSKQEARAVVNNYLGSPALKRPARRQGGGKGKR